MGVEDELRADLRSAMKQRDAVRVSVLRSALGAVANAEAVALPEASVAGAIGASARGPVEVARRELSEDDVRAVLIAECDEARTAAADLRKAGRGPDADALDARVRMLETYLS